MLDELVEEYQQLKLENKYIYRFIAMLDSIVFAYKVENKQHLKTLISNAEKLLDEYREDSSNGGTK